MQTTLFIGLSVTTIYHTRNPSYTLTLTNTKKILAVWEFRTCVAPGVTRGNLWQTPHRWSHTNQKIEENAEEGVSSALWQSHYLLSGLQHHSCCSLSCNPVSIFHYRFIYMPEQMTVCWASDCRAGPDQQQDWRYCSTLLQRIAF
jgi:hypothetical protein